MIRLERNSKPETKIENIKITFPQVIIKEQILNSEEVLVCNFCGSIDIEKEAWVHANSGKYVDEIDECSYWCGQCEVHPKPITLNEYNDTKNKSS